MGLPEWLINEIYDKMLGLDFSHAQLTFNPVSLTRKINKLKYTLRTIGMTVKTGDIKCTARIVIRNLKNSN